MDDLGVGLFDEAFRDRLEQRMLQLTAELLAAGGRGVIELGSWSGAERDQLLALGRDARCPGRAARPGPDADELWRRLAERNTRPGQVVIDRPTLGAYLQHRQAPDAEELSHYDAHHE